jgi:hypothetical protein
MEKFLDSNILPFFSFNFDSSINEISSNFASSLKNYIKELLELNLNY